jgi:ankyrin repeat protein
MMMAMNCLHGILKGTNDLFSHAHKDVEDDSDEEGDADEKSDADCWTSISQPGSDFEKFRGVFNQLSLVTQAILKSVMISNEPDDLRAALSTLRFQVLLDKTRNANKERIHCPYPVDAESILKESNQLEDPAISFFMGLAIIEYCQFGPLVTDSLHELHAEIQSKCLTLLRHLDLYDKLPSISQQNNIYYPEKIAVLQVFTAEPVVKFQLDCLGRNQLHHIIDDEIGGYYFRRACHATQVQNTFNEADIFGRTPLHAACHKMNLDSVETLLNFGADVRRMTVFGSRPLHYATARGSTKICEALLATHEIDINALDKHGCSALAYAIRKQHVSIVKLLLSEKLRSKADPNVSGTRCQPPLIDAIQQGNEKIVRHLLNAGANPGIKFHGGNAFHFATSIGNLQMIALLAETIPKHLLDTKNEWGDTPLMMAVRFKFTEGASLISELTSVDMNARDKDRCTTLMLAARTGQNEVVEVLLKHTIYASAVDAKGRTAADLARAKGYSLIAGLIELYEKENETKDNNGYSESIQTDEDGGNNRMIVT